MEQQLETPAVESEVAAPAAPKQELSEEQNALLVYQHYLNKFMHLLGTYQGSKKQIQRSWINAAISPMNKDELQFSYPEEKEIFDMFVELNSAKFVLMLFGMVKDGKIALLKPLMESNVETTEETVNG